MIKYETNSKLVTEGQTFVAIKGNTVDGHDYIEEAIKNGAQKIICEKDINVSIPYEKVEDTKEFLKNALVKEYSKYINDNLKIIGVTGTNGKTTSCYLIYQMLNRLNVKCAYLGTIGYYDKSTFIELNNTTPDILTLYKLIYKSIQNGNEYLVMEVSSHALSFERIAGLKFIAAGFTNLTEDHLDYHKTMDAYLKEKVKILNYLTNDGYILLNSDDENSKSFMQKNYKTFGFNGDYKIVDYKIEPDKTNFTFTYNDKNYNVTTNLTSKFNIYNYLTMLSIINTIGFDIEDIIKETSNIYPPKGRCETIKVKDGYAIVDYAHTPDAVEKIITSYNELKKNKVITVVGCGGDRDPIKRPIMGDIATNLSDYVIFTNDNPRTEDPNKIMNDIIKDNKRSNFEVILDRKKAILRGIELMEKDDILLVLGKGHEDYQIIGHDKIHFDDAEIIRNYN